MVAPRLSEKDWNNGISRKQRQKQERKHPKKEPRLNKTTSLIQQECLTDERRVLFVAVVFLNPFFASLSPYHSVHKL
jgi:hypothetical protein